MFAYFTVPLKRAGGNYPDHNEVQNAMRTLGFEIRFATSGDGTIINPVKITIGGSEKSFEIKTVSYYQALAQREIKDPKTVIEKEISRWCIFTGASTQFEANIFVNRIEDGSVKLVIYQIGIDKLLPLTQKLISSISSKDFLTLFDLEAMREQDLPVFLASGDSVISRGNIIKSKTGFVIQNKTIEFITFLAMAALFVATFILYSIPLQQSLSESGSVVSYDPLAPFIRYFAANTWPAAAVAAITLLITLLISIMAVPKNKIAWSWRH